MSLNNINLSVLVNKMQGFSGAEIKATCTEAGYFAIRKNRTHVTQIDFEKAIEKIKQDDGEENKEMIKMFG